MLSATSAILWLMDPTTRLLRLMALLQQRPDWSSEELADNLGVTSRTVRRDIARLRDLGYDVDAAPGPAGGYRLRAGTVLPPLVLNDDEAVVLVVGLRVAALSGLSGSSDSAVSALAKLEGLLPSRLAARVSALAADVISLTPPDETGTDPQVLATLALACRRAEHVALGYTDAAGRATRRDVGPYRVVHADRRWYLVAQDLRREVWRTFRVDRITHAEPLGGRVRFVDPPDAAALVAESVTTTVYPWTASVRLELPEHVARRRVRPTVGQLTPETETTTLLRIGAVDLDWLARYLVGLHCNLEVVDPPELVEALRELGRSLSTTGARLQVTPPR
jgi:predicted DNA-binding transcriptional regulator YafY